MVEFLARKCRGGDLWISAAKMHLNKHEWGLARNAVLSGLEKGHLSDLEEARRLLEQICELLGTPTAAPYRVTEGGAEISETQ